MSDQTSLEAHLDNISIGGSTILFGTLFGMGVKFISEIVIGRFGGSELYGSIWIGFSILSILSIISLWGLNTGVARWLPREQSADDKWSIVFTATAVSVSTALCISGIFYFFQNAIITMFGLPQEFSDILILFLIALPFYTFIQVFVGIMRGYSTPRWKVIVNDIAIPTSRIIFIALVGVSALGTTWFPLAYVLPYIIAALAAVYLLIRILPSTSPSIKDLIFRIDLVKFSYPLIVLSISTTLINTLDNLFLGYFKTSSVVGLYNSAFVISSLSIVIMNSVGFLFMPIISKLSKEKRMDDLNLFYAITTKIVVFFTLPGLLILFMFPGKVLAVFYGTDYRSAATALQILTVGYFFNLLAGRTGDVLIAQGHNYLSALNSLFGLGTNIILNIILIPIFGMNGAAFATAFSLFLINALGVTENYYLHNLSPFSTRLLLLPVIGGALLSIYDFSSNLFTINFISLIGIGIIGISMTFIITYIFNGFTSIELQLGKRMYERVIDIYGNFSS